MTGRLLHPAVQLHGAWGQAASPSAGYYTITFAGGHVQPERLFIAGLQPFGRADLDLQQQLKFHLIENSRLDKSL